MADGVQYPTDDHIQAGVGHAPPPDESEEETADEETADEEAADEEAPKDGGVPG
jgi:hypothetical protein